MDFLSVGRAIFISKIKQRRGSGEYELMIGPMTVEISGERGSRMTNRMPTVKQTVAVGAGLDVEVTLVMTLEPEPPAPPQR